MSPRTFLDTHASAGKRAAVLSSRIYIKASDAYRKTGNVTCPLGRTPRPLPCRRTGEFVLVLALIFSVHTTRPVTIMSHARLRRDTRASGDRHLQSPPQRGHVTQGT